MMNKYKERRLSLALTQDEVSVLADLAQSTISKIERNNPRIRAKTYKELDAFYSRLERKRDKQNAAGVTADA